MRSSRIWSKRLLLCLLPMLVITSQSGCSVCRNRSQVAGALSDYWEWRAEKARYAEAKAAHEREEKAKAKACAHELGRVEEVVKTDYTITLEKGMEIDSMSLDFEEVEKMKALQTKLDKEYEKAKEAYDNLVLDIERQRQADQMALARGEHDGSNGCVPCAPTPGCAQPPRAPALPPPPKRRALGTESLPIVIHARYKLSPRQSMQAKTEVERRFQPGKAICEPKCCPECRREGCTDTGQCPRSFQGHHGSRYSGNEPAAVPPSNEEVRRNRAPANPELERLHEREFESTQPFTIGTRLFEGELNPLTVTRLRD